MNVPYSNIQINIEHQLAVEYQILASYIHKLRYTVSLTKLGKSNPDDLTFDKMNEDPADPSNVHRYTFTESLSRILFHGIDTFSLKLVTFGEPDEIPTDFCHVTIDPQIGVELHRKYIFPSSFFCSSIFFFPFNIEGI